jgi:CheY-like chemotaxis protein
MRILICDDNKDAAMVLGVLFSSERHDVYICHDGASCVEKAREWHPDVGLVDIGMPGLNGYDVARAIRQMDFGHDVLLVAITGWGAREDVQAASDAGFDLHLLKPANSDRLLRLVESGRRPRT